MQKIAHHFDRATTPQGVVPAQAHGFFFSDVSLFAPESSWVSPCTSGVVAVESLSQVQQLHEEMAKRAHTFDTEAPGPRSGSPGGLDLFGDWNWVGQNRWDPMLG